MLNISVGALLGVFGLAVLALMFGASSVSGLSLAVIGAALAVFGGGLGSSMGVGIAAEAAAGVTAEDPEKFGRTLLLQALPGTQGFYGLIGGFLVMNKLGFFTGAIPSISMDVGWQIMFACMPVAFAGLVSAIAQGRVAAAGIAMVGKRPEEAGKGLVMAALVETYAVLGLLATLLLLNGVRV